METLPKRKGKREDDRPDLHIPSPPEAPLARLAPKKVRENYVCVKQSKKKKAFGVAFLSFSDRFIYLCMFGLIK